MTDKTRKDKFTEFCESSNSCTECPLHMAVFTAKGRHRQNIKGGL